MEKYREELKPGNVVVVDCRIEKYMETTWTKWDQVSFKIWGISYIAKGVPPLNKLSTLGSSPSKRSVCKLHQKYLKLKYSNHLSLENHGNNRYAVGWMYFLLPDT